MVDLELLEEKVEYVANAISDPNISYCASIDMDVFPVVIELGKMSEADVDSAYRIACTLDTLRFLAKNDRLFPREMKEASLKEFWMYLKKNEEYIFNVIEGDTERYYMEIYNESPDIFPCPPCPYCEGNDVEVSLENGRFHCRECDSLYEREDILRQDLRHRLSPLLSETSETAPRKAILPEVKGFLSFGEPYGVIRKETNIEVFLFEDGTMWYHIEGDFSSDGEKKWQDVDTLSIKDLHALVLYLENAN